MNDINLRPLAKSDLETVRKWRNSPEVSQYMYSDSVISVEDQINWFVKIESDPSVVYWLIEYANKPLGVASLTAINRTFSSCYWAFYLGDTSIRGAGLGAKVEYQVLQYVFNDLALNKLRCEVFSFNEKVIRMHEKFGFRREAYYREHCFKSNKYQDVVGLAILKSEWAQIEPSLKRKIYGV